MCCITCAVLFIYCILFFCFFFSSRRRHTRFDCDWSSDVCSSDLEFTAVANSVPENVLPPVFGTMLICSPPVMLSADADRSEERRVGKECRSRWSPYH